MFEIFGPSSSQSLISMGVRGDHACDCRRPTLWLEMIPQKSYFEDVFDYFFLFSRAKGNGL